MGELAPHKQQHKNTHCMWFGDETESCPSSIWMNKKLSDEAQFKYQLVVGLLILNVWEYSTALTRWRAILRKSSSVNSGNCLHFK